MGVNYLPYIVFVQICEKKMSQLNPYSAPDIQPSQTAKTREGGLGNARQSKRFFGFLIDQALLFGIGMVQGVVVVGLLGSPSTPDAVFSNQLVNLFAGWIVTLVFYVLLEGTTGRTLGKQLMGTRVVSESGEKATFGQILGRSVARFIPFEPFSFLFCHDTGHPSGWHDRLSRTMVVEV